MFARQKKWLLRLFRQLNDLRFDPVRKGVLALEIQEELLRRIVRAEALIRRIRLENKQIKKDLANRNSNRDTARAAKAKHVVGEERIERHKALISVLRSVGDALVFIYGDRFDLKQLALKEPPGFISGKRGTRLERQILRASFRAGATVIMNDLTNTLRHGDLTIFRPDLWPEGGSPFILLEAKSGRGGDRSRMHRQKDAANAISSYLSTDKRYANGGTYRRMSVKEYPTYHFEIATRMMNNLPSGGWLIERAEPGLIYVLIDCDCEPNNYEAAFRELPKDLRLFTLVVNDMKSHTLGYYPFPLSIQDPEALFRFYDGEFVMLVLVDIHQVNRIVLPAGVRVTLTEDTQYPWHLSPLSTERPAEMPDSYVGSHVIGRLAAEFLRLDWLLQNVVIGLNAEVLRLAAEGGLDSSDKSVN